MCRINEQIVGFADAFVDMPKWNDVCKIGLGKVSMYPILCLHDPRISIRGIFFVCRGDGNARSFGRDDRGPHRVTDTRQANRNETTLINDCSFCPRLFYGFTIEWSMEYLKK